MINGGQKGWKKEGRLCVPLELGNNSGIISEEARHVPQTNNQLNPPNECTLALGEPCCIGVCRVVQDSFWNIVVSHGMS